MTWVAIALIVYFVLDSLYTVLKVGTFLEITPGGAVLTIVVRGLQIWAVVYLAAGG